MSTGSAPFRVLVVCTGNICRSPMAEVVLGERFADAGLDGRVVVDSAGISDGERGNPIDRRARAVLAEHGYPVPSREARQVTPSDVAEPDLLLAMTDAHARALRRLGAREDQVRLYRSFEPDAGEAPLDVPDPWYGDREDFEECLATVEAGAPGIVAYVQERVGG
ncbi:protein tyrosine phosphatase [Beutenbergia cavernae DSM 12333]|uniref:protein-tyrosine-phosphatase n=1 Tax=Beutenbergia cavernae (strain ATCC BAA-8 / DSM 12333 / CCUG 43141 / JCM 11478 / NBRC 16432 / NCIMB 13614 / HKI 0122) TaxID=471853 RepID=C5BV06_BEUC1|nr:low molecular weight protein-tyrosine-phosphatase [Beutenbergia cavernae]ACQ78380.1 protein tyrosine phosphatase [Beutenbergia cavernae DSM 12333]